MQIANRHPHSIVTLSQIQPYMYPHKRKR
uniref:Uncharacterized protein n=1 Tax=Rhizophora mucronata TaxID=61149 RepID=A0A2P2R508_RHIMU